jgi:hypothetical protein
MIVELTELILSQVDDDRFEEEPEPTILLGPDDSDD